MLWRISINALRFQQVRGAVDGIFQSTVGIVDGGRHHYCLLLLEGGGRSEFVGMKTGSQGAVGLLQAFGVDIESGFKLEECEILRHGRIINVKFSAEA